MVLFVLLHHWVIVVHDQWHLFHFILNEKIEDVFIAARLQRSDLFVLPLLLAEYALDRTVSAIAPATLIREVLSAGAAYEDAELHDHVRGQGLLAVEAVVVERVCYYALEEFR